MKDGVDDRREEKIMLMVVMCSSEGGGRLERKKGCRSRGRKTQLTGEGKKENCTHTVDEEEELT